MNAVSTKELLDLIEKHNQLSALELRNAPFGSYDKASASITARTAIIEDLLALVRKAL